MNEHFKGPWKIVERETMEDGSIYPRNVATEAGDYQICLLESATMAALGFDRTPSEQKRDLLIAAAPDLLAALKSVTDILDGFGDLPDRHMDPEEWVESGAEESIKQARAAIARALPQGAPNV